MQYIKAILEKTLNQLGLSEKIEECKALTLWNDIASTMASKTQPTAVSHGRLIVNVSDSVILHTLSMYKKRYIEKINLLAGKNVIKDIIFRVGAIENNKSQKSSEKKEEDYIGKLQSIQLDQEEIDNIDEIVSVIKDDEIRESLRNLFIKQSKLSKMRGRIG
ncbi:MAG: DUF721 domain-containing protein [Candidatus Poribacteria bacterium]